MRDEEVHVQYGVCSLGGGVPLRCRTHSHFVLKKEQVIKISATQTCLPVL